jgi:hypothetical protein
VDITPEQAAMLERQRAYFASDEHIKRRAEPYRDATPAECVADLAGCCRTAAWSLGQLDPETLDRALVPDPLPDTTRELLSRLWAQRLR